MRTTTLVLTLATAALVGCSNADTSDAPARRAVSPGIYGTDVPVGTGGNAGGVSPATGSPGPVNGGPLNGPGVGTPGPR